MASTDELYMTVKGKGGHGAMPHQNIDPVLIASHIVVALQQIVSRNVDPLLPTVLSFGKVVADGATNVIPAEVKLEGTRSEEHTSELQSLMRISYAVFCLKKKTIHTTDLISMIISAPLYDDVKNAHHV